MKKTSFLVDFQIEHSPLRQNLSFNHKTIQKEISKLKKKDKKRTIQ